MRRQLEGSYNIQKIIALEDEQKNKERVTYADVVLWNNKQWQLQTSKE